MLHGAKRNFTKPNFDDLRRKNTQLDLQESKIPVKTSLSNAARFLNGTIGFHTGLLLPYALQLLLLGVFFIISKINNDDLDDEIKFALSRWFWGTSFEGWFASANTAEIERAVRAVERFAGALHSDAAREAFYAFFIDRPLRTFPRTFDRRSARIRAMLLVQIARGAVVDPITGDIVDGSALMADPDRRDLPYVFSPDGTAPARSPANRILLPRSHGSVVRTALGTHLERIEALESHGINQKAREAIETRNLSEFVLARELELQHQEREFLKKFNLDIGNAARSDEEIDIEDE